jgi:TetR/AcrR family transcriptional repressor of nem operon
MGRNRGFDEADVVRKSAVAFLTSGYEATSIDDLVNATGLHRGSLYQAFGRKRGLFVACLSGAPDGDPLLDLMLVALLELAPRDREVRDLVAKHLPARAAETLGARLLERAQITTTPGGAR